ncbi:GrxA family glutaredoxin [Psittacicella hinzii]|uniref:GrxA family glutaredoxin n=1 Tax=Psittacicella hinzii TaxID=2028575 RepID=A0A3A1YSX5_9GAMM|nr:GrxA family glutaredoxin [Psittacicella hinzii]RIY40596.1 GrxA family glutaredoxin [Psittacicella hinzii]
MVKYQVEIFGRESCPYCQRAKNILEELKVAGIADGVYHDMIVEGITKEDIAARIGKEVRTVPQVFVNGNHVGGCDNFVAFLTAEGVKFSH